MSLWGTEPWGRELPRTMSWQGPLLWSDGVGGIPPRSWSRSRGPTYLVLYVGMDSLQHPLTGVLVGQVGVYL